MEYQREFWIIIGLLASVNGVLLLLLLSGVFKMKFSKFIRYCLTLFFLLLVFDGALRKWFLPEYGQFVFVLKDFILAATFSFFLLVKGFHVPTGLKRTAFGYVMVLYVAYCFIQVFNPALPNFLLGIWGFKLQVLYASLIILIPAAFPTFEALTSWLKRYLMLSVPIFILCIFQFNLPPDHLVNIYARSRSIDILRGVEAVRVTGTFSYISGMAYYVFWSTYTAFLFLVVRRGGKRILHSLPYYVILILGSVALFMTGSRYPLFAWGVVLLVWGIFLTLLLPIRWLLRYLMNYRAVFTVLVVILLGYWSVSVLGTEAVMGTTERLLENTEGTRRRLWERVLNPINYVDEVGLFGYGMGSTYQAAGVLTDVPPRSWLPSDLHFEEALERQVIELGAVGFTLLLGLYVSLVVLAYRTVLMMNAYRPLMLAFGCFAFLFACFTEHIFSNPVLAAYFWTYLGVVVAVRAFALERHPVVPRGSGSA